MKTITVEEFKATIKSRFGSLQNAAFTCPRCGVRQTAQDLIDAGAGEDFDEVKGFLGFSCVGRFTGAGAPRKARDGKPCNWTLGGLFKMHELEVITPDGKHHPHFDIAEA